MEHIALNLNATCERCGEVLAVRIENLPGGWWLCWCGQLYHAYDDVECPDVVLRRAHQAQAAWYLEACLAVPLEKLQPVTGAFYIEGSPMCPCRTPRDKDGRPMRDLHGKLM